MTGREPSRDAVSNTIHRAGQICLLSAVCRVALCCSAIGVSAGCQTLGRSPFGSAGADEIPALAAADERGSAPDSSLNQVDEADRGVVQAGGIGAIGGSLKRSFNRAASFVSGRPSAETAELDQLRALYQQGDAMFRQAQQEPREQAQGTFAKAAKIFARVAKQTPKSALGQDAMFMHAESLFFADNLNDASEAYGRLQRDHPRNRHSDRVAARLFSIGRYWIEVDKAGGANWIPNFTDKKLPTLDADGHAIRVLDQIRFDDPTGRLADDATMAAAAEYIRQGNYEMADEFLTDLRETYGDSEHQFLAHLLGIRCKLEVYAGPHYSNLLLDEADKLVDQTRRRFPDRLREQKYADMVARAAAEISYHQAEKLLTRAEYRDKQRKYRAAARYYQELLDEHGDTPFAETARKRLAEISDLPAVPEQQLAFLTKIFRDRGQKEPLKFANPPQDSAEGSVLR